IGGTFTDLVAFDPDSGRVVQSKALTTHDDLPRGVWDCLRKAGVAPRAASTVVHGSTIAINIAIEQKGAKTALVVTRGTRDVYVSLSHGIVGEYREYERTSTTVMNAYIGPETSAYVGSMDERLRADDFDGRFLIMQSNGGVMSPAKAKKLPVAMMESGPVGG